MLTREAKEDSDEMRIKVREVQLEMDDIDRKSR